jgi:hypothetical protein
MTTPPPEAGGGSRPSQDNYASIELSRATTPAQAWPAYGAELKPDDAIIIGCGHDSRRLIFWPACVQRLETVCIGLRQNWSRLARPLPMMSGLEAPWVLHNIRRSVVAQVAEIGLSRTCARPWWATSRGTRPELPAPITGQRTASRSGRRWCAW